MAKVKIFLENGETIEDAEDSLFKAMEFQNNGDVHTEQFDDPAMQSIINKMEELHRKIYQEMLQDVFEALDQEYSE